MVSPGPVIAVVEVLAVDKRLLDAVQAGSVEGILAAARSGANVNARDEAGETALTYATGVGLGPEAAAACVQCLLGLGARVSEERPSGGLGISVHQAALNGYTTALSYLLSADGRVSFGTFDDMSRTPLICAVQIGHLPETALLLDSGADVNAHDGERIGNTALIVAVEERNLPMVQLLLEHGADPTIPGWMQLSALDRARDWAAAGTARELREILELLEKAGRRQATGLP